MLSLPYRSRSVCVSPSTFEGQIYQKNMTDIQSKIVKNYKELKL